MVKFTPFLAASIAVFASTVSAHEGHEASGSHDDDAAVVVGACAANVSASVIAVVENVTYFDTCATGTTFKLASLLDATKLSTTDFFTFCNSSACLAPLHTVMHEAPLTCLVTYKGSAQNLTGEITELHDKCHAVKDAAKAATSGSKSSSGSKANATVTTPAPTTSAATSVNSKVLAAAIAGCAAVASLLL